MTQIMFGHRTVPKVAKYAIVIYEYTSDEDLKYLSHSAEMKAKRTAKKMTLKLIERLKKQPQYNFDPGNTNILMDQHLRYVLEDSRHMDHFGVWMLQLNQYVHTIIHELAKDYDPNNTEAKSSKPFYYEIYKELTE